MPLVTRITKRLEVPGESSAWIEIRMLSWVFLNEARNKRIAALGEQAKSFAGLRDLVPANGAAAAVKDAVAADPTIEYDLLTVLRRGITSWSYSESVEPEELDEVTAKWAAREIVRFALPGEAETKKDSSPSTVI